MIAILFSCYAERWMGVLKLWCIRHKTIFVHRFIIDDVLLLIKPKVCDYRRLTDQLNDQSTHPSIHPSIHLTVYNDHFMEKITLESVIYFVDSGPEKYVLLVAPIISLAASVVGFLLLIIYYAKSPITIPK